MGLAGLLSLSEAIAGAKFMPKVAVNTDKIRGLFNTIQPKLFKVKSSHKIRFVEGVISLFLRKYPWVKIE
jgi:hypothetical protein